MKTKCSSMAGGVGMVLLLVSSAMAGPIAGDPNAMPAWQGTQQFYVTDGSATLQVDVEYAVYLPGDYYVYAYQVFNDLAGNRPVSNFSVGLDPASGAANIGWDAGAGTPGGTAPSFAGFSGTPPTSSVWYFFSNTIDPPSEYSQVLLFTSPYGPRWAPATVMDSGLSNVQNLPSPMPEPATLALLALGGIAALIRRRRGYGG